MGQSGVAIFSADASRRVSSLVRRVRPRNGEILLLKRAVGEVVGGARLRCPDGDVVISHEQSGFRWMDPQAYRDRYLNDEILARVEGPPGEMLRHIQDAIDAYLVWQARG